MLGLNPNLVSSTLLWICAITSFWSYFPQIIKTLKIKKSDDVAISSWIIWTIEYFLMAIYAFIFTVDFIFFITTFLEGFICLATFLVCLKYRS